jgi:hypothetical protein
VRNGQQLRDERRIMVCHDDTCSLISAYPAAVWPSNQIRQGGFAAARRLLLMILPAIGSPGRRAHLAKLVGNHGEAEVDLIQGRAAR